MAGWRQAVRRPGTWFCALAALLLVLPGSARAISVTFEEIVASWVPGEVRFHPLLPEPEVTILQMGAATELRFSGPSVPEAFLRFTPEPVPVGVRGGVPFRIGTLEFANPSTTLPGPIRLSLKLEFSSPDPVGVFAQHVLLRIRDTSDDVLDITLCPAGSRTLCDDVLELVLLSRERIKLSLEDGAGIHESVLVPEGAESSYGLIGIGVIPEPAPALLVGLGLGLAGMTRAWRRRPRP